MNAETSLSVIRRHLAPVAGKRVLDCGCGGGALAKVLAADGAAVTGIDPSGAAVAAASTAVPDARFEVARAEALPFADASFDAAIFLNALHHVPASAMRTALREALRVTVSEGPVVVIEPLAEGSYNDVLKIVDDETLIRAQAQQVIEDMVDTEAERLETVRFERRDLFEDFDAFVARAIAVDASRAVAVAERRAEIEAAFRDRAERGDDGGYLLRQPHKADVLTLRRRNR